MEVNDTVEVKQLIKYYERFLNVANTVYDFRNNLKALKICKKLINIETKSIQKSKQPVDSEQLDKILLRYIDLRNTIVLLIKTKDITTINNACADIKNMILVTEAQIAALKGVTVAETISAASQKIVNAIGDTAQKIGNVVSEKIDGLKKRLVGEESSE